MGQSVTEFCCPYENLLVLIFESSTDQSQFVFGGAVWSDYYASVTPVICASAVEKVTSGPSPWDGGEPSE